ncbi:MAG: hypothetical protein HYY50_03710 [Candidatus Kerfeldbacteria bacterium]|nr:hypothetical protein [Candidatus Kerfeldbacteria bacterium]
MMPPSTTVDANACSRFDSAPPAPIRSPSRHLTRGLGYFTLFVVAVALLASNNVFLSGMAQDVAAQKQAAAEAKKPAAIETIALVSPDCRNCYNVNGLLANLDTNEKVTITNPRTVDVGSEEGTALIKQFGIGRSPAFIIRGQTEKLLTVAPGLKSFGQLQGDVFVGSNVPPPYVDLTSGQTRGIFQAIYMTEKGCQPCYDPTINRQALAQVGMIPAEEKTIDRVEDEGQKLVKRYSITTTPTLILTGDLASYVGFDEVWKTNAGTIEPDGAYVFRSAQDRMGTYYDLITKKVITPPTTSGQTGNPNTNISTP